MKCLACGQNLGETDQYCSACGFVVIESVTDDPEVLEAIRKKAEEYLRARLAKTRVAVTVYQYKDLDSVDKPRTEDIVLAKGEELKGREILWYKENFARLSGKCRLNLKVTTTTGKTVTHAPELAQPATEGYWRIGIQPQSGLSFRVVVGNVDGYTASEPISLCD